VQNMQVDQLENLKNEEVIVYCRSGNRSGQAAMILETLGFTNTKNLSGGMLAWQSKFGQ
jgi:rhodanese-related sulfurtransferase